MPAVIQIMAVLNEAAAPLQYEIQDQLSKAARAAHTGEIALQVMVSLEIGTCETSVPEIKCYGLDRERASNCRLAIQRTWYETLTMKPPNGFRT